MSNVEVPESNYCNKLGIQFTLANAQRVEGTMPLGPDKWQPWGYVHGGATISFLESLASCASEFHHDPATEAAFGVDVHVRHKKPGKYGTMYGSAQLDHEEASSRGVGRKQFWRVEAHDEVGDTISDGIIMTKVVPLEYLAKKDADREAAREKQA